MFQFHLCCTLSVLRSCLTWSIHLNVQLIILNTFSFRFLNDFYSTGQKIIVTNLTHTWVHLTTISTVMVGYSAVSFDANKTLFSNNESIIAEKRLFIRWSQMRRRAIQPTIFKHKSILRYTLNDVHPLYRNK